MDIEAIIAGVIDREGGFTDHPADRGGPTNMGITLRTLTTWRGRPTTVEDLKDMPRTEAAAIYRHRYVIEPRLHVIQDPYVLVLAVDCGVLHGTHRAIRWLQQIVGVVDDGVLGPISEVAINTIDPIRLYNALNAKRVRFVGSIISSDPELRRAKRAGIRLQAENAAGWCNRVASFIDVR